MNIYRILGQHCQDIKKLGFNWSDCYDGFIVVAENEEDADKVLKDYLEGHSYQEGFSWIRSERATVELIGTSNLGKGVLFQSWSSTG